MDPNYIARNEAAYDRLRALVERLTPAEIERDLGDGWNVKAALGHLAFWDRFAAALLGEWQHLGFRPHGEAAEIINVAGLADWLAAPNEGVVPQLLASARAANATAAKVEADLVTVLAGNGQTWFQRFVHREEHIEQVERVLGKPL